MTAEVLHQEKSKNFKRGGREEEVRSGGADREGANERGPREMPKFTTLEKHVQTPTLGGVYVKASTGVAVAEEGVGVCQR